MSERMTSDAINRVFIIDASIFIFKYYFSMPQLWQSTSGQPTETAYGYALWLSKFLADIAPKRVVACFDESLNSCYRNELYPGYKTSRALPDEDLAFQLLACKKITELFGIPCFASERFEADDLIGCFATLCHKENHAYAILSKDRDLSQLIYSADSILWDYPANQPMGPAQLFDRIGVHPHQMADFLALVGDPGDDIPGVPGIGKKTAAALLMHFGNWASIKSNLDDVRQLPLRGAKTLQGKIASHVNQIDLMIKLTTIVTDAIKVSWKETRRQSVNYKSLLKLCVELGFPASFTEELVER